MKKILILLGLMMFTSICSADDVYIQLPGINFGIGSTPRYYSQQPTYVYEQPVYVERPVYYNQYVPVYRNWYGVEEHHYHGHHHEGHHHGHHDRD